MSTGKVEKGVERRTSSLGLHGRYLLGTLLEQKVFDGEVFKVKITGLEMCVLIVLEFSLG